MKTTAQILEDLNKYDIDENKRNQYSAEVINAIKSLEPIPFAELEFEAMDFHALTEVVQTYDIGINELYAVAGRIPTENLEVATKDGDTTLRYALMAHDKINNGHLINTLINQMISRDSNFYEEYKELIDASDVEYFTQYQTMKRGGVKLIKEALALKLIEREDLEKAIEWGIISADEIEFEDIESNLALQSVTMFDSSTNKKVTLYQYLQNRHKEKIKTDEHKYNDLQAKESKEYEPSYIDAYIESLTTNFNGEESVEELLSDIGLENIDEIKMILKDRINNAQKNNPIAAFNVMCSVTAEYMNSEGYRSTQIEEIYQACQEFYYGHQITPQEQQSAVNLFEIPFAYLETHQVSGKVAMSQLSQKQQSEKEPIAKGVMLDEIFKMPCKHLAQKRNALHQIFPKQEQFKGNAFANWIDEILDLICNMLYSNKAISKGYEKFAINYKGLEYNQNIETELERKMEAFSSLPNNASQSQIMSTLYNMKNSSEKETEGISK